MEIPDCTRSSAIPDRNPPRIHAGVAERIGQLIHGLFPGWTVEELRPLAPDGNGGDTRKADGYGRPLRVLVRSPGGKGSALVFRTATSNSFGHDRRSDRAAGMLLAFDTFNTISDHVRALDVGTVLAGGRLRSLRDGGEFYLLTTFAEGRMYSEHLRRIADEGAGDGDLLRCEALARWLVRLHSERIDEPDCYTRAVRDLLGHGEGIFGMVDGYGPDVPGASPARLRAIEERCLTFRWRLRGREGRLARTHGDFHPFNVVFAEGDSLRFTLLDASRGCKGDPADDVTAMAVNFVFFAMGRKRSGAQGLLRLWRSFWKLYLEESGDRDLLETVAPWLAWRCLVLCNPRFYPGLSVEGRDAILSLAERALEAPSFDPRWAEELFA
ncbi:MAG: phosphotransferase family protein [Myxococcales bacterium]